jgi:hypothetical protein
MKLLGSCLLTFAAACATTPGSSSGDTSGNAMSHLEVRMTDAPATFDAVLVTIAKVEVETADESWITLSDQPHQYDLLQLQNDATELLGGADLAAGTYGQLRLIVSSAAVVITGVETPLTIASGAQTGIKINLATTIEAGTTYTLVLDYDAAKSIKLTGHGYLMTPVINVKSTMTGSGSGSGSGSDAGTDT